MSAMGLGRFCVIVTHICVVSFKRVCFDRKGWKSQTYRAKFFFRNFSRNLKNFKDSVRVIEYCAKHAITCSENGMSSSSLSSGGSANSQQQQKKKQPSSSRLSFREEDRRIRKQEQCDHQHEWKKQVFMMMTMMMGEFIACLQCRTATVSCLTGQVAAFCGGSGTRLGFWWVDFTGFLTVAIELREVWFVLGWVNSVRCFRAPRIMFLIKALKLRTYEIGWLVCCCRSFNSYQPTNLTGFHRNTLVNLVIKWFPLLKRAQTIEISSN